MGTEYSATFFILILAAFVNTFIGFLVLSTNRHARLNRRFFILTVCASVWVLTNLLFPEVAPGLRLPVALASYAAAGLLALMFVLFCNDITDRHVSAVREYVYVAIGLIISTASAIPHVIADGVSDDLKIQTNMIPLAIYGLYVFGSLLFALILLLVRTRSAGKRERQRVRLVLKGMAIGVAIGVLFNLVMPLFNEYRFTQYGPLGTLIFMAMNAYAIVKHGLFDIKQAAIRTAAYLLSLATLSVVYFLLAYFASITVFEGSASTGLSTNPINIVLALVLAFIFQPVKRFFDKITDQVFFKDRYNTDEFIERLSEVLTTTTDLRNLLQRAAAEIGATLKSEQAFFSISYNGDRKVISGTHKHALLSAENTQTIVAFAMDQDEEVIVTELLPVEDEVKKVLTRHKIALVIRLVNRGKPLGLLLLGEQKSSGYTTRDVRLLSTITDELGIAIQNSLSIQEVRDINIHLQQRIDEATEELRRSNSKLKELDKSKDEFISMASHQLRTPLTAVKGYVSMLLEGDIGKISTQQREVLEQAYDSSQRMVFLIGDFLNVSRLQTGKFVIEPSTINYTNLVDEEVDQLKDTGRARKITLHYHKPDTAITGTADENKLRQVMMNFMDNAIFYSPAGTSVDILLYKDAEGIVFKVSDHGIGVPKAEQVKLFTKFFRAENARQQRPDGTGIGIYMAKKVIAAHGGSIIFESKEGVGSTFGFKIPLEYDAKKLNNQPDATAKHSSHNS